MWWSYTLAAIGVFGLWLTGRKLWQGFAVGVAVQFLWIAYAIVTEQWGFIGSALAFGWMNAWNLRKWLRERRTETTAFGTQPGNPWVVHREHPAHAVRVIKGGKKRRWWR